MEQNEINVTDVMLGDWVLYEHKNIKGEIESTHYLKVENITSDALCLRNGEYWRVQKTGYGVIKPIPLTAEILEKNLSTTSQIQYCWDDFLSRSFGEDFYEIRYHGDVTELVISIRYIHELQHVLRLCNIVKEINL